MKNFTTTLICFVFCFVLHTATSPAQTTHPIEFGFNFGKSWLQSDVKMGKFGGGVGFTFGQMYLQTKTSPIDIGWRIRGLITNAYGQEYKKFTGIDNNPVFNGTYNSSLNYKANPGFIYQNYHTYIAEWGLEGVIGGNSIRENTRFHPYIFGGIGWVKVETKTNQLDTANQRYNYFKVDSLSNAGTLVSHSLSAMQDDTYETFAEGGKQSRKWMPSVGIGMAYYLGKSFSIGVEHKITWAMHDFLDGQQWTNNNILTGNNDIYHYTSVILKISFGRTIKTPRTATPAAQQTTEQNYERPTETQTGTQPSRVSTPSTNKPTTTTPSNNNTNNNNTNNNTGRTPPANNNTNTNNNNSTSGRTPNTNTSSTTNNTNSNNKQTAKESKSSSVKPKAEKQTKPKGSPTTSSGKIKLPAPKVTFTKPASSPSSVNTTTYHVEATVTNVSGSNEITVKVNGTKITNFVFNSTTNKIEFDATNLQRGSNTVSITAKNPTGNDSKSITLNFVGS